MAEITGIPVQGRRAGPSAPTSGEVITAAAALGAALSSGAVESRQARRVPDSVIAAFRDAGLNRVMQPNRYGGWAMGLDTEVAVAFELAKGDAAQAWTLVGYADAAHVAASFGDEAQGEVWRDSAALIVGDVAPRGVVTAHKSEFIVTGEWTGVAGLDHADWFLGAGLIERGEQKEKVGFLVRKSEVRVSDEEPSIGLEGAGAKCVALNGVSVPAHRVLEGAAVLGRRSSLAMAAVPLGAAAAMIDAFSALCADTARRGRRTVDNFATGLRIAESKADVDAGFLSITAAASETMAIARRGEPLPFERRALNSLKAGYAVVLATRAADRIFAAAGAKAILQANPMQRYLLDIHNMAAQEIFAWDATASDYGLLRVGDLQA